jgi:hypothetical protein
LYQITYYFLTRKIDSMIRKKSILGFGSTITAIILIGMATATFLNVQAQTSDAQQIRNYLIQAIQALDNGDNSEAIRQLQLATDQMGSFAAVSEQSSVGQSSDSGQRNNGDDENNDDEGEGSEEGEGEDEDEPGDIDSDDEED